MNMIIGFLMLFLGFLLLMSLGLFARWLYFKITRAPKKIKKSLQNTLDFQISRAIERNHQS